MEQEQAKGKVVQFSPELNGVVTTTERVIHLTKVVWFQRGLWAGAVFGAVVASIIWWVVS